MKMKMHEEILTRGVMEEISLCGVFVGTRINRLPSKPKMLIPILALEKILLKNVAFVATDDKVYCEVTESSQTVFKALVSKGEIHYEKDEEDEVSIIIPYLLWNLSDSAENPVLKNKTKELCEEYLSNGKVSVSNAVAFNEEMKKIAETDVWEVYDDLNTETVQAYLRNRNTEIKKIRPLQALEFPAVSLDIRKPEKKEDKGKAEDFSFDKAKNGEYALEWKWSEEARQNIPSLDVLEDFIPNSTYWSLVRKIAYRFGKVIGRLEEGLTGEKAIGNDYVNVMLYGKPSSGKSVTLRAVASTLQIPFWVVNLSKNSEEDTFECMNKMVGGQITLQETPFFKGFTQGGICVLEEIDLIYPDVIMGAIGQAIEKPFVLNKDGYIPTLRCPLTAVVGTKNVLVHGCKDMSQALRRRFKQSYEMEDPKREDFIAILEKRFGDRATCEWVYDIYSDVLEYLDNPENNAEDIALGVTLSSCIGCLENIEEGVPRKEAVRSSIIGKIGEVDVKLAQSLYDDLVKNYRES